MKAKLHFLEIDDVSSILNPAGPAPHIAGTKVIATLGPACHDVDQLVELLECGMSCARIDLTVCQLLPLTCRFALDVGTRYNSV